MATSSLYGPVEALDPKHDLDCFDCGSGCQTTWLRRHARQSHASGMSRVFVVRRLEEDRVVGFYALTTGSILHAEPPERLLRGAGRYDLALVILARLGVDLAEQGQGLGRALVVDALHRVDLISSEAGARALLIHAEDDDAKAFYLRLASFDQSPVDPRSLLLLMKDLRRAIG
ncbi:MAG: N-acetyltransferase [Acidimicrobiales bacterium]